MKESTKKAKKAKFDQSQSHSTSQKKQALEEGAAAVPSAPTNTGAANGSADADTSAAAGSGNGAGSSGAGKGSIQDLRARLHARIEALRQKRKAPEGGDEQGDGISKRRRRAQRKAELIRNRAAGLPLPPRQPRGAFAKADSSSGAGAPAASKATPELADAAAPVAVPLAIDYGVVKFGSSVTAAKKPKKGHTLQQLLAKVRTAGLGDGTDARWSRRCVGGHQTPLPLTLCVV